jgi:predicted nuclease of predicted toxin-antitoxin system
VRVLLDEQLPRQLAPYLTGHEVRTVQQQGWAGLKNGELLQRARRAGFEAFVTADQNLTFQQNLQNVSLFVVVLIAPSNALEDLLPVIPAALAVMVNPKAGEAVRIGGDAPSKS